MGFNIVTRVSAPTRNPKILALICTGFLNGVVANNLVTMRIAKRQGRPISPIYELARTGKVRFQREAGPHEEFADVLTVLRRGWGDCDDLVAWRVAELQAKGEKAQVRIYWRVKNGSIRMHAQVRRANGRIEDPSRYLGM